MSPRDDHPLADSTAAYALGALDTAERQELEVHLENCAECRAAVAEYRAAASLLSYGVAAAAPGATLRSSILERARADRPAADRPEPERQPPALPMVSARRAAWWQPLPAMLMAASLVLAALAGYGYLRERSAHDTTRAAYQESVAELARREALLAALLAESVSTARLTAADAAPSIRLFWNRTDDVVVIAAFNLPPAAPGRTYQLWGIPDGEAPVSLGTFDVATGVTPTVVLPVPPGIDLDRSTVSAVTDEPTGGSPQPTTTPFLAGGWEHAR